MNPNHLLSVSHQICFTGLQYDSPGLLCKQLRSLLSSVVQIRSVHAALSGLTGKQRANLASIASDDGRFCFVQQHLCRVSPKIGRSNSDGIHDDRLARCMRSFPRNANGFSPVRVERTEI